MAEADKRVPTGVPGLDHVLAGGLPAGHLYLVEGASGAGKTTLGLQFLMEGARAGEKVLWCTLAETETQLRSAADSHGWDLRGIEIVNVAESGAAGGLLEPEYSFFAPGDVELSDVIQSIVDVAQRVRPQRVVFDPFSDVKLLARDPLRYRRQLLQLREHFAELGATVLLIQEHGLDSPSDPAGEGVVHGIIALYQHAPDYGKPRRRLRVHKLRGVKYREGFHDIAIETGGIVIYPRLVAGEHAVASDRTEVASGIPELDQMMGGGLDRGSSLLVMGPSGAGKSTLCSQYLEAAALRGEHGVVYLFDETRRAFFSRAEGLHMQVGRLVDSGVLDVVQVDPAEFSPGEFAHKVRRAVEQEDARIIVIDSLNGYLTGMPDEKHLAMHMHELLTYLSLRNVVTVLTLNLHGVIGDQPGAPVDVSYLADAAILIRYFEAAGAVRRAISVVKRRCGPHEVLIREMTISPPGVQFGAALSEFHGVLTGQPSWGGPTEQLKA
ncbi:ATPase domain-containing protein [Ramlibacter sp. MMS24-I3-19]|uniref:ATPase domain-containing protein n=1 Tax=Ramlibacter sp. MMS24-I3-19 TaxID=3416606 RepID=UPI003D069FCE